MIPEFLTDPQPHELYARDDYLVIDFETTNLDKGSALNKSNRLVLTCWKYKGQMYYNWGGEYDQAVLLEHLNECSFIIAHNAKFECQWLERCGFDIGSKPYWDTFSAEWVLAGNRNWRLNLDACLARRKMGSKLMYISNMIKDGTCPSEINRKDLFKYCAIDVAKTEELFLDQRKDMVDNCPRLIPITFSRAQLAPVLADIERNGMHLSSEQVEQQYADHFSEFQDVGRELEELTGGINPRSTKQVAEFVYDTLGFAEKRDRKGKPLRTPSGRRKTDEATLLSLEGDDPKQQEFLRLKKRYAQLASALDKNLKAFVGACRERGGMLYGEILQGRTQTHRLASTGKREYVECFDKFYGCQFQNLPRVFKPLFTPRDPEWDIVELDGSQLEFRAAGHLGDDDTIRLDIEEGTDIHSYTASIIFEVDELNVPKDKRTAAKAHTFKPLYGGTSGTENEQRYYRAFSEKYSSLTETQQEWARTVLNQKKLETEWGLVFYWPYAKENYGYLNVKTSVYNYPVQSFATAEIIPLTLIFLWHRTRTWETLLINTVHDSVIAEVPQQEKSKYLSEGYKAFTSDVYTYLEQAYNVTMSVPLGIGAVFGKQWSVSAYDDNELEELCDAAELPNATVSGGEISAELKVQQMEAA